MNCSQPSSNMVLFACTTCTDKTRALVAREARGALAWGGQIPAFLWTRREECEKKIQPAAKVALLLLAARKQQGDKTPEKAHSLVSHGSRLDHEVPEGEGDLRVDHLEVALHHEVEGGVGREELQAVVVAVVRDLPPRPAGDR